MRYANTVSRIVHLVDLGRGGTSKGCGAHATLTDCLWHEAKNLADEFNKAEAEQQEWTRRALARRTKRKRK